MLSMLCFLSCWVNVLKVNIKSSLDKKYWNDKISFLLFLHWSENIRINMWMWLFFFWFSSGVVHFCCYIFGLIFQLTGVTWHMAFWTKWHFKVLLILQTRRRNVKSLLSHEPSKVALICVYLGLSQTPVYTARTHMQDCQYDIIIL